jgi:hypothetical protein
VFSNGQVQEHEHEYCLAFFCTDVLPEPQNIFTLARKVLVVPNTTQTLELNTFHRDDHLPTTNLVFPGLLLVGT